MNDILSQTLTAKFYFGLFMYILKWTHTTPKVTVYARWRVIKNDTVKNDIDLIQNLVL